MTLELDQPAMTVREEHGTTPAQFEADIANAYEPVVMRGLAMDWPAVAQARASDDALADYVEGFGRAATAEVMIGTPDIDGRFFYDPAIRAFNFQRAQVTIPVLIAELLRQRTEKTPVTLYAGASSALENFPGWTEENRLPLPTHDVTPRLWIGNASRVSTHYDVSDNIAVVVGGRRRFCLFPPTQVANLYVGPLDATIAGQPVSLVDLEKPDLERFPRFRAARQTMRMAILEPGDAIFIPSLWWHDVKAEGSFNLLVNYWWGQDSSPLPALVHALLTIRDLPAGQKEAMQAWFDTFVFADDTAAAVSHIPEHARGPFGPPSEARSANVAAYLARTLARDSGGTPSRD